MPPREAEDNNGGGITLAGKMAIGIAAAIIVVLLACGTGYVFGNKIDLD